MLKEKLSGKKNQSEIIFQKLNFDNISNILKHIGLIEKPFTNAQKVCIEFPNIDSEIKKTDKLDTSMNNTVDFSIKSKYCNCDIDLSRLYTLYSTNSYNVSNMKYSIEDFTLIVKIFVSIMNNFNDDFFKYDFGNEQMFSKKKKIKITNFKSGTVLKGNIGEKIEVLYKQNDHSSTGFDFEEDENDIKMKNIVCLINYFTLFGSFWYTPLNFDTLMKNIDTFNMYCFGDIKIFVLVLFQLIILTDIVMKKLSVDKFLSASKKNRNDLPVNNVIPNFFYFNGDISKVTNEKEKFILIQLLIKLQILPYIVSNLSLNIFCHIISLNEINDITSYLFNKDNDAPLTNPIETSLLIQSDELIMILKAIPSIDKLYMKISQSDIDINEDEKINEMLSPFIPVIVQAKSFYCEIVDNEDTKDSPPFAYFYTELSLLIAIIKLTVKVKSIKNKSKANAKNFFFRFTSKCFSLTTKKNLSQNPHVRDITLFLSQSHCSESTALDYLSKRGNLSELYFKLQAMLLALSPFKKYSIGVRLTKSIIQNEELKFYMNLVYLQIENFIHDNPTLNKAIVYYEGEYISYKYTIVINSSIKQKKKNTYLQRYFKRFNIAYVNFLNTFANDLNEYFSLIVIHDEIANTFPFNPRILLRNFEDNQIVFINKENQLIDIFVYISDGEVSVGYNDKILDMIKAMKTDNVGKDCIDNVYLICKKKWFAEDKDYTNIFALANTLYIIDTDTNFDCVFDERQIVLHSFMNVNDKKEKVSFFVEGVKMFRNYYDIIKDIIITKKIRIYNDISCVYRKKALVLKKGILMLKKITNYNCDFISNEKMLSSTCSYPLMILTPKMQDSINDFNLGSVINLYENFGGLKTCDDNDIQKEIELIMEKISSKFSPIIFTQKYYSYMRDLAIPYDKVYLFPIEIKNTFKVNEIFDNDNDDEFKLGKCIVKYEFKKSKLNFFTKNEIGKLFSFGNVKNTIEYLNSISITKRLNFKDENVRSDTIIALISVMKNKYQKANYITRKDVSLLISDYIFANRNGSSKPQDIKFIVDFSLFADEVRKFKKKKKENKTLITYKEEDNSNANNNNNTTKANNTNTNHVNEQMESENAIVQSSSTSTVNRVPFKHETKAQVVKHFIGNKFSQIKKIFKK